MNSEMNLFVTVIVGVLAFGMSAATFVVVVFSRPRTAIRVAGEGVVHAATPLYTEALSRELLLALGQEVVSSVLATTEHSTRELLLTCAAPGPSDFLVWYFAGHGTADKIAATMVVAYAERCKAFAKNILANTEGN